ncbi:unnamed protein product [Mytilus edulis]|uniref:PiggyBac transposable element-derived protein domain-containing protein n=1 Tax=Mytilus edulis TaxID=6550 RepID=A0A8S3Q484_MYTED|nr:unnamed protein product [Mytilus edulis]
MVGFKGRHHLVQYMPGKKSHRWGPKWHVLAEGDTGYVNTLSLYCGKGGARSQHGSGFDLVTDLVNPFYNKWHHVLVDNAFCSPHLCHYLLERNTYITGTVRVHRKGMPSSFKRIRVPKGEREVRQQGQLMAMKYGDRKQVTFLSTFSDPRIIPTTNARGVRREVPTVVNLYNKKMGGVDLGDQHIQSYDPDVRSLKMWKKLLINMILRVIANAYLIYKQVNRLNRRKLSKLQFWTSVCTELIGECRNPNNERGRPSMSAIPLRMTGKHYPYFWQGADIYITTPKTRDYTLLSNYGISATDRVLTFQEKACSNAYVGLMSGNTETEPLYEIVFGGYSNTVSFIRAGKSITLPRLVEFAGPVLDCSQYKEFRITWDDNTINVSHGLDDSGSTFLTWTSAPLWPIQNIGISTAYGSNGEWIFHTQGKKITPDDILNTPCMLMN